MRLIRRFRAGLLAMVVLLAAGTALTNAATAQDVDPALANMTSTTGHAAPIDSGNSSQAISGNTGNSVANGLGVTGEFANGMIQAFDKLKHIFDQMIANAVTISQNVSPHADKLAFSLGVITIVFAGIRFTAVSDPVSAWVGLFEELTTLGIFASLYVSYYGTAPHFRDFFQTISDAIQPNVQSLPNNVYHAAGQLWDAFTNTIKAASMWDIWKVAFLLLPLVMAIIMLLLMSIMVFYFTNIGIFQLAAGIAMGKFAVAAAFSNITRGFFTAWVDYMIHAGMYMVAGAIVENLALSSVLTTLKSIGDASKSGPVQAAIEMLAISMFALLLSFEIPKLAGMFGGGAGATGSALKSAVSMAAKFAKPKPLPGGGGKS